MHRTITIGRWMAELYDRAIHIHRGPDPDCWDCAGAGGFEVGGALGEDGEVCVDPETELCDCWDPTGIRIPLWRKPRLTVEPF